MFKKKHSGWTENSKFEEVSKGFEMDLEPYCSPTYRSSVEAFQSLDEILYQNQREHEDECVYDGIGFYICLYSTKKFFN